VREEERAVLAREIHDELGQLLTALKFEVSWMRQHLRIEEHVARARLEATLGLIAEGVGSVRRIIASLRPSLLDDLGLVAALEWQVKEFGSRTGLVVEFL
jgi:signal transduction histidine kinase